MTLLFFLCNLHKKFKKPFKSMDICQLRNEKMRHNIKIVLISKEFLTKEDKRGR